MTFRRKIFDCLAGAEPIEARDLPQPAALRAWIEDRARQDGLKWLLAHTDAGVIWGHFTADGLVTSDQVAGTHPAAARLCPSFEPTLLQQLRLFGTSAEILIWADEGLTWRARVIRDPLGDDAGQSVAWRRAYDEPTLLLGRAVAVGLDHGFTVLHEGAREGGFRQALPLTLPMNGQARLHVRHYLTHDPEARVVASRLVAVTQEAS